MNLVTDAQTEVMEANFGDFGGKTVIAQADAPYSRGIAWTEAGKDVARTFSSAEALEAAQLDWTVSLGPILSGRSGEPIPSLYGTYRDDNDELMGYTRGRYVPLQNREMFEWTDDLVKDGVARYVSAGQFFGGRKVWLLMEMSDGMTIAGEAYRPFLMAVNGHDGSTAFRAFTTVMRVYCYNTFLMAIQSQDNGIRVQHHAKLKPTMSVAAQQMTLMTQQQRRLAEWLEQAAETPLKRGQYGRMEERLFGVVSEEDSALKRAPLALFREIYAVEAEKNGETAYSFFNASTGFADHGKKVNGKGNPELMAERRMKSLVEGSARGFKTEAIEAISAVTKLPLVLA